jgi:trehalose/maltose transport system substrate-binding protein
MTSFKILCTFIVFLSIILTGCQSEPITSDPTGVEPVKMGEVTLRMNGPAEGPRYDFDKAIIEEFEKETGIKVELVPGFESTTDRLTDYTVLLSSETPDFDVYQIDVIWPGILGEHFVDLNQALGEEASAHFPSIIENNTVNGRLVGMPWYTDAGLLYYRTDLLEKYGFDGPPETWDELEEMAQVIQTGEQSSNPEFWGYVWQGNDYEGLTCDALEWQVSHGGGQIIEPDGTISVNNPQTIAAFERAASWVGRISPEEVTRYQEGEARGVWQAGNAAFMRNWPYAYALSQSDDSMVKGKFEVTLLPSGGAGSAATLGGWQLAVSKYSKHQREAIELVKYLTSPEVQLRRAIGGSYPPTIAALYENTDVLAANPYYSTLKGVFQGGAVARPSGLTGEAYVEVSFLYYTAVNDILEGRELASEAVADLEDKLIEIAIYNKE